MSINIPLEHAFVQQAVDNVNQRLAKKDPPIWIRPNGKKGLPNTAPSNQERAIAPALNKMIQRLKIASESSRETPKETDDRKRMEKEIANNVGLLGKMRPAVQAQILKSSMLGILQQMVDSDRKPDKIVRDIGALVGLAQKHKLKFDFSLLIPKHDPHCPPGCVKLNKELPLIASINRIFNDDERLSIYKYLTEINLPNGETRKWGDPRVHDVLSFIKCQQSL
jgi:hypothetical protein